MKKPIANSPRQRTLSQPNRRHFLRATSSALLGVAIFPEVAPSSVLGADGTTAPSNRLAVGCVGVGPQGQGDMSNFLQQSDARVVAVCDVKKDQLAQTRDQVNQKYQNQDCATFEDFRELMARKDIDVVLVATPDHWHIPVTLAAMRAGKDVYCEKPLGLSLQEHQLLRQTAKQTGRIFQFGTQQRSQDQFRQACELVRNGRIGKLRHINVWAPGSTPGGSTQQVPVPPSINYDFWLGPAPYKPYTEDRCSSDGAKKTWWFISDYTLGFITGWGIHPMDIALWGAGPELKAGPITVEGFARFPAQGACDTATIWDVNFQFANGVTMKFVGTPNGANAGAATGDPWPQEQECRNHYRRISTHGTAFEGTTGWVHVDRGGLNVYPESLLEEKPDGYAIKLKRSSNHVRDLLDSVKQRVPAICPVEDAIQADQMCHLADIAARLHRQVVWNPVEEKFVQDDEAQKRIASRVIRPPWKLG
jgi:glucose-fructose oxidoreductase